MKVIRDAYDRPWPREDVLEGVGPGWRDLVSRLIDDLFELGWDGNLSQIKEKFGGLRFYIGGGTDEIHARINSAEAESYKTCDACGEPGVKSHDGWIRVLCETHTAIQREGDFIRDEKEHRRGEREQDLLQGTGSPR